jgi:DNA-binding CsgD family transcriptional regulator
MRARDERAVRHLLDALYGCAGDDSLWPQWLADMAESFSAPVCGLTIIRSDNRRSGVDHVVQVDPIELAKYGQFYAALNPWFKTGFALYQPGKVITTDEVLPLAAYRRSVFYNEWGKQNLVTHGLGGVIRAHTEQAYFVSVNRGDAQAPFAARELEMFHILMPHLKRVMDLRDRISVLEAREGFLDALAFPLLHVASDGRLLWANLAASQLLSQGSSLCLRKGKLAARVQSEDGELGAILSGIRYVDRNGFDSYGSWLQITDVDALSQMALFVSQLPTMIRRLPGQTSGNSGFMVFVATHSIDTETLALRLQIRWGLTPAESALAVTLLDSESLQGAADLLQIARNTAKSQLAAIFQKASVKRQIDFMRKLLTLAALRKAD